MLIDAWWFSNTQGADEIIQPDFFIPRTHLGLYADGMLLELPIHVSFAVSAQGKTIFEKQLVLTEPQTLNDEYELAIDSRNGSITGTVFAETPDVLPDHINIRVESGADVYAKDIRCEYATLSGYITDFSGNAFPAAFELNRIGFGGEAPCMGVWSGKDGNYSITVPKGTYNAFYVDDNSYGKTSLENWGWHMIVDRDENHDFKVGNGEVYNLNVWSNNGGYSTLFIYFRPMTLQKYEEYQRRGEYKTEINGREFSTIDLCPDLRIDDVVASINGHKMTNISLQRIMETGDIHAMHAYILQARRYPENEAYSTVGKQTLIVEYNSKADDDHAAQSQGRTQFFYKDAHASSLL